MRSLELQAKRVNHSIIKSRAHTRSWEVNNLYIIFRHCFFSNGIYIYSLKNYYNSPSSVYPNPPHKSELFITSLMKYLMLLGSPFVVVIDVPVKYLILIRVIIIIIILMITIKFMIFAIKVSNLCSNILKDMKVLVNNF